MNSTVQLLQAISQPGDVSFRLTLADNTTLDCQQAVRVVPQKRVVCRGLREGRQVYAKLFFGADARKYAVRDANGVRLLTSANINTPSLLYQGETADKNAEVLVFQAIESAKNAEDLYGKLRLSQQFKVRLDLMQQLTGAVAQHHAAGLLQTDLYLKNFLVENEKIYTLDGDGIRRLSSFFKKHQTQRNLATLFSKFDVLDDEWMSELYAAYCKQMDIVYSPFDEAEVWMKTQKIRRQVASDYADKKVFRQCTDVKKYALKGLWILVGRAYENIDFSGNLDALLMPKNSLKSGNTCTVALAEMSSKKVVIKRYNIKNFWHAVSRAFRQTRAAVSWANAHRLKVLGIATANPIALIENKKIGFLNGKAYFLSEFIEAPDVREFFAQTRDKKARAEAIKNIATLFYKLFLLQISHNDTKATNIKMVDNQPVLIDLDSMRQHRTYSRSSTAHLRDLNRFMQNWENDNALYNAFVKTFKVVYPDVPLLVKAGIFQNKELSK